MSREAQVRFCERRGARFPPPTLLVLMVAGDRHQAEALREEVSAVLAPLGLRLAPEKTEVVHIDEGFTFLGFDIRRLRKRGTGKYYVYTKPSRKAVQAIKDKVKAKTYRSTRHQDLDELIRSLNPVSWRLGCVLPDGGVQEGLRRLGHPHVEARLQLGEAKPPEQVEPLGRRPALRRVQKVQE